MSIVSVTLVDLWCVISSFTFTLSSSCCVSSRFVMVRRQGTLKVGSRNSISLMKAGTSTMDIGSMHLPIRLPMRSEMRSERLSVIGRALNAVIFGCGLLDLAVDPSKTVGCLLHTCRIGADVLPPVHAAPDYRTCIAPYSYISFLDMPTPLNESPSRAVILIRLVLELIQL